MPNRIEPAPSLSALNFVAPTSRYLNAEVIKYFIDETSMLAFKTFKRPERSQSDQDRFYVITPGTEYRPDIVAKGAYGKEGYWWVLLLANDMKDILDFRAGKTILVPTPYN